MVLFPSLHVNRLDIVGGLAVYTIPLFPPLPHDIVGQKEGLSLL